jgi:hypothetical protein
MNNTTPNARFSELTQQAMNQRQKNIEALRNTASLPAMTSSEYSAQMILLEQQNKKRLLMARQEQARMFDPDQQVQGQFPPAVSQTPQSATQSQFSPVVRQSTPMAASAVSMQQTPQMQNMSPGNPFQRIAMQKATMHIQQQGVPQGQNPTIYQQHLAQLYSSQIQQAQQQQAGQQPGQQPQNITAMSPQGSQSGISNQQGAGLAIMSVWQLRQQYQQRKAQLLQAFGQNIPQRHVQQMHRLELHIKTREQQAGQKPGQQPQNITAMSPQGSQSGISNQQGAGFFNMTPNQTNETAPKKRSTKGKKV